MSTQRTNVRVLDAQDVPAALKVLELDPVTNVFVDYRTRVTGLQPRWLGGEVWGWFVDRRLVSMCHAGANFVPVNASPEMLEAYADYALERRARPVTLLGKADDVQMLWDLLGPHWGQPRDFRWEQPHLVTRAVSNVAADPLVRRTRPEEVDTLYPACVAMYTEEVGISPELDGGRDLYRARVAQFVNRGWSFSRIEDGTVLFKAEVACATPYAAQIQGVYVDPDYRGQGLATAGMASVVNAVLGDIAPAVSLYVNAHNAPARAAYERVGFKREGTFATIMF